MCYLNLTGLLSRYPAKMNVTWTSLTRNPATNEYNFERRTGHQLLHLYQQNHTIRVFERLLSGLKCEIMSPLMSSYLKMDLFDEYSYPRPFPNDKFLRIPKGSPNQSYVMLGQKGTGTVIVKHDLQTNENREKKQHSVKTKLATTQVGINNKISYNKSC